MFSGSQIERVSRCPGSETLPKTDEVSDYGEDGNWIHAYLERAQSMPRDRALEVVPAHLQEFAKAIELARMPLGMAGEVAYAYHVDTGKVRELGRGQGRCYDSVTEREIPTTLDVVGLAETYVFVGDYKTGWGRLPRAGQSWQLRFGALCAARANNKDRAIVEYLRIRDDGYLWRDRATLAIWDLDLIEMELKSVYEATQGPNPSFRQGPWCKYCPGFTECPAKTALLRRLQDGGPLVPDSGAITTENAQQAYVALRSAKDLIKRVESALYAYAARKPIPLGDGWYFGQQTVEGNERLDGDIVWAEVRDRLGRDVADEAVQRRASKAQLRCALKRHKLEGQKLAPLEREILGAVRTRGGASRKTSTRFLEYQREEP